MHAPAALIAIPLLAGSGAGLLVFGRTTDALPILALGGSVLACLAAAAVLCDRSGRPGAGWECAACVACGAVMAGLALGHDAGRRAYGPPLISWFVARYDVTSDGPVTIVGRLREDAARGGSGPSLIVDVERVGNSPVALVATTGGVRLTVAGVLAASRAGEWRAGRRIRATAVLRVPAVYANPGVPDGRRSLARRGIALVGSIKSAALVEVIGSGSAVAELAALCRTWVRRRLSASVGEWSARSAGIASAILVGERSGLAEEDERRLQEAGTYHVIAISGGNIAMLTLLCLGALRALRVPPRAAAGLTIAVLLFYSRITGPAPSVDRAVTAAIGYLAGRLLDRRGPAANVLAVAATLAVAVAPAAIFDPGFVLSFGATIGILLIVPRLMTLLSPRRWAAVAAAGLLAATVAAEIALLPMAAGLFSRVAFAGLVLNFAAIPLMTMVQAASIAALIASPVSPAAASAAGYAAHVAAAGLVDSARLVDVAPWLSRAVPPPSWWLVTAYYASVIAALLLGRRFERQGRVVTRAPAILAIAIASVVLAGPDATSRDRVPPPPRGWLRVVLLDVGQGDATLVRLPEGRAMLVDAGGLAAGLPRDTDPDAAAGFDVGERVVVPALRALGVRRLDTFVATHGDPDHVGGSRAVLRAFPPRAIWEGVPVPPHAAMTVLAKAADRGGAEWRSVQSGERLRVGAVTIEVLHPPRPDWERQRVRNDDSIVLHLRLGRVSIVLPGDIGAEGERAILPRLDPNPVVVLKAPHHGSATSSTPELLHALDPAAVIFSAGRGNRFGHPAPSVVARYRAIGARMFSTAVDGAVFVETDGKELKVWGWTAH